MNNEEITVLQTLLAKAEKEAISKGMYHIRNSIGNVNIAISEHLRD